ncbi:MAG: DUF3365 domain-containing protein [Pirellulaceae bacterium]
MKRMPAGVSLAVVVFAAFSCALGVHLSTVYGGDAAPSAVLEARSRARVLHETIHGALQVMHRDFFDEEQGRVIPSRSLEDVFHELERSHHVTVRWMSVNTSAMNVDHEPQTEFEKNAAKALASGRKQYEEIARDGYQYAGLIRLSSRCLKCHVPNRTSTEDRAAALTITMSLSEKPTASDGE